MRSINDLHTLSFFHNSSGICLFEEIISDSLRLCDCDTKSCRTAVNVYDIFLSAKSHCNQFAYRIIRSCYSCTICLSSFFSGVYVSFCIELGFCIIILTSRSLEIKLFDHKCKDYIVQNEINNTNRDNSQPACLFISLQNTKQEQVKESTGESKSHCDI